MTNWRRASMVKLALVSCILWSTAGALPAQFFTSTQTEPRRLSHATWLGLSGEQSVAFEYGQAKWRAEYESFIDQRTATPVLLGKGALATLRNDVELGFGQQKVARGRWYVSARRTDQGEWSLVLFAADRVDADGRGATAVLSREPEVRIPVRVTREKESVEMFEITLTDSKEAPHDLVLLMAWGPHRLRANLAASFDRRMPEGAPTFAPTAADAGTKTASGLIYEQLRAGAGKLPGASDRLRVHYVGWLTDGTMFASSYVRGAPEVLVMDWVVPGFAEGLALMRPGSTFRLTIPPALAFGVSGLGSRVPPDATVVYTVTLLGVEQ